MTRKSSVVEDALASAESKMDSEFRIRVGESFR
jgi:hypothetical protein